MDTQRERHRLYHGTLKPGIEIDLPVNALRRETIGQNASFLSNAAPPSKEQLRKERVHCHLCQLAKFLAHEYYPIKIVNDINNETLPDDFRFIERSILCQGVEAADEGFRTGCECEDDEDCMTMKCSCLQDMDVHGAKISPNSKVYAYQSRGPNKDCLRPAILNSRDPIYECHEKCLCSTNCNNSVVERGRKVPLEIFRTPDGRGWGKLESVRSGVDIREGQFVDTYVGEIITPEEAQRRRKASDIAQRKDVYLFALDKFSSPDSMDPRLAGPAFEVDGEFKSGPTRFINHSCNPNMRIFARVGDHADKHIHDLALFAIRFIPAGEELTFDYVDGEDGPQDWEMLDPELRTDMVNCLCGEEGCRGYLW